MAVTSTSATALHRSTGAGQTGNGLYAKASDNSVQLWTNSSVKATLDSSGNLGLGVTPSAWGTAKAFQIGGSGFALSSNAAGAGDGSLTWNGYYNGTNWIYSYTGGVATRYRQNESGHAWFITADTGTAGDPISFTQAMTLDASGNLLVGGTSLWSSERLGITGSSASQRFIYARTTSNGHYLSLGTNGTLPYIEYGNGAGLAFTDGATERARIDSSGNLGLGVTPSVVYGKEFTFSADITSNIGGLGTRNLATNNGLVYLSSNTKNTGAFTDAYWLSAAATKYTQNNGVHAWFTAASGTAGDPISFTQAMTLDTSGNLLVGKTSSSGGTAGIELAPAGQVIATRSGGAAGYFNRLTSDGSLISINRSNTEVGSISVTTTATAYNTSSDYRLKNITGPITTSGAYIDSLNPVEGTWKADGSTFVGLIAHEVQEASRTTVATGVKDGEEMQGMDYSSAEIIANLIAEVKALRTRVAKLEAK
jgi:hypothetical protein